MPAAAAARKKPAEKPKLVPSLREAQGKRSQRVFAAEIGIAVSRLNEVLKKKRKGFSARDALAVSQKTGIDLQTCLGL